SPLSNAVIDTLSLHDALPIYSRPISASLIESGAQWETRVARVICFTCLCRQTRTPFSNTHTHIGHYRSFRRQRNECKGSYDVDEDRKSTRLNSSHVSISYAVF